jgi:hypothetical protein
MRHTLVDAANAAAVARGEAPPHSPTGSLSSLASMGSLDDGDGLANIKGLKPSGILPRLGPITGKWPMSRAPQQPKGVSPSRSVTPPGSKSVKQSWRWRRFLAGPMRRFMFGSMRGSTQADVAGAAALAIGAPAVGEVSTVRL